MTASRNLTPPGSNRIALSKRQISATQSCPLNQYQSREDVDFRDWTMIARSLRELTALKILRENDMESGRRGSTLSDVNGGFAGEEDLSIEKEIFRCVRGDSLRSDRLSVFLSSSFRFIRDDFFNHSTDLEREKTR